MHEVAHGAPRRRGGAPPGEVAGEITNAYVLRAARALLRDMKRGPADVVQVGPRPYDDPRISGDALEAALVRLGALDPEHTTAADAAASDAGPGEGEGEDAAPPGET
jgi:hypothetical protein